MATTSPASPKQVGFIRSLRDEPAAEGIYAYDGAYYKVMLNRAGTRTYARKLTFVVEDDADKGVWTYVKGMVYALKPEHRLTKEQAKEFGDLHHYCIRCGRELTVHESIARGMGPKCWAWQGF